MLVASLMLGWIGFVSSLPLFFNPRETQFNQGNTRRILDVKWGRIQVEGRELPYKDCKLWPGGGREWNWGETGTHHVPGLQVSDVEEILQTGVDVLIIGNGMTSQLGVPDETLANIRNQGVTVFVYSTPEAVVVYNNFIENGKNVGGIFHSTC